MVDLISSCFNFTSPLVCEKMMEKIEMEALLLVFFFSFFLWSGNGRTMILTQLMLKLIIALRFLFNFTSV